MNNLPNDVIKYISYYFYQYDNNNFRSLSTKFYNNLSKIPKLPFEIMIHISKYMDQKNRKIFYIMDKNYHKWYTLNYHIFKDTVRIYGCCSGNPGPAGPFGRQGPSPHFRLPTKYPKKLMNKLKRHNSTIHKNQKYKGRII